jgi:hypothetical protein
MSPAAFCPRTRTTEAIYETWLLSWCPKQTKCPTTSRRNFDTKAHLSGGRGRALRPEAVVEVLEIGDGR